ncbi:MAG TPA: NAD(P)H-binding protein [Nitrospirota bacterium]|nr:NAD(P)H-binding protein [Nitrospirota bacterium]
MTTSASIPTGRVLIVGATGYVGRRLVPELANQGVPLRLAARKLSVMSSLLQKGADIEIVAADLVKNEGLAEALAGIDTAYYLVHSMGGRMIGRNEEYAERDRQAAKNFIAAAGRAGLKRVIYLGGLGESGDTLSEHLRSRAEIANILSSGTAAVTVLRAAIIIGAEGASYEMLRYLVERLPVLVCPRWVDTRIQPIAIKDVLAYLAGVLRNPDTAGKSFDIGGPEIFTYAEMMQKYAEVRGLAKRIIIRVPVLTPLLSAYWVDLVTPVPSGIAHPLIEGLRNEVICKDNGIDRFVPLRKTTFAEAVRTAHAEEKRGPGVTGF